MNANPSAGCDPCCLCGLMCAIPNPDIARPRTSAEAVEPHWSDGTDLESCQRRCEWLSRRASVAARPATAAGEVLSLEQQVVELLRLGNGSDRLLLWIDGADVASMRAMVEFARRTRTTLHVGQSTGATLAKRVMVNQGWLGTTLGEVANRADLIVTVGDCALSETPLLPARVFRRSPEQPPLAWWHISSSNELPSSLTRAAADRQPGSMPHLPAQHLVWPRDQWLRRLTELQIELQDAPQRQSAPQSGATALGEAIRISSYAVWLWDNSEFTSSVEELIISRLLSLARQRTHQARCALLNMESNVGQLTAEESLLWLTGCSGTATWDGTRWETAVRFDHYSAEQWQAEFQRIALVRATPSIAPLPDLRADVVIASAADVSPRRRHDSGLWPIAAAGIERRAHLFRGDRGATLLAGSAVDSPLPSAADLFARASQRLDAVRSERG